MMTLHMRLPNRKPGKYTFPTFDANITAEKLQALQGQLERAKGKLPQAIHDTQRYGENGDFSENAEYQIAKGRLRGLLRSIDELQYQINHAQLIPAPTDTTTVQVGHTVTVETSGKRLQFKILGSTETNPTAGVISYQSPLGKLLLGHQVSDTVLLTLKDRTVEYQIITIQ